jgi:hypothetical protein|nr:MAG TPA_asm: tail protein [Caudoviricetes sp.]
MLVLADGTILAVDDYCIKQKYNGINELSFSFPDDIKIVNEQSVHETTRNQAYLVKIVNGNNITCELDLDELRSVQTDYDASATPHDHLSAALTSVGWNLVDNTGVTTRRTITGALTPMEIIEQVEDTWAGVTAMFDTATKTVTILCPSDNKPQYAFLAEELNLRQLDIAGDSSSFCTRLRAKGADGMTFASINNGKDYVENYTYSNRIIYGVAISDERFTNKESLLEYAQATLDANAVPAVSYECDVVDVAAIDSDYSFQKLQMHKAVWLLDKKFETRVAHRIVEYCIYPNDASKNKVTLSTVIPSLQGSVKSLQTAIYDPNSAVRQRETSAVENATKAITGASGGNIRFVYDGNGKPIEFLIMDTDDIATAQKVWRFNIGGFGFSSNGYNGTYATAITQDGHIVADFMDVGTLTAVLIKSQDGKSKWNLSTGDMELFNTKLSTIGSGATYQNSDYSQADLDRIGQINIKAVTPTLVDYEKLDVNGDGTISITDTVQIQQIIAGTRTVNFTTRWAMRLDPSDGDNLLKIYRVYHNNTTGADTENVVFSVGFGRALANTLEAQYGDIEKDLSVGGSVDASGYKINGAAVTFPAQKTIGYVVYCTGGSNNKASCFIPSGVSGSFQCASNDWYCAFNFDGSGNVTKTGGTGSVASVSEVKNF